MGKKCSSSPTIKHLLNIGITHAKQYIYVWNCIDISHYTQNQLKIEKIPELEPKAEDTNILKSAQHHLPAGKDKQNYRDITTSLSE